MKKLFRHGDLLLKEIDKIPDNLTIQKDNVLALGEATGHKHQFLGSNVKVMVGEKNKKFIEVSKPSILSHEEHSAIEVDTGNYELIIEREFDYFSEELRLVQD